MHVRVGNFRSYGADKPPEGRVSEAMGIEILGDEDELVVLVIAQPEGDGWMVHLDRYEEAGGFDLVDHGRDRVVVHVSARFPTGAGQCKAVPAAGGMTEQPR